MLLLKLNYSLKASAVLVNTLYDDVQLMHEKPIILVQVNPVKIVQDKYSRL